MAIKPNALAKGDSVIKLIELITGVNTKRAEGDTALQAAINEVREMFKTDELTEVTTAELMDLMSSMGLEPGHKYKLTDYDEAVVSAVSTNELERIAFTSDGVYDVNVDKYEASKKLDPIADNCMTCEVTEDIVVEPGEFFESSGTIPAGKYYVYGMMAKDGETPRDYLKNIVLENGRALLPLNTIDEYTGGYTFNGPNEDLRFGIFLIPLDDPTIVYRYENSLGPASYYELTFGFHPNEDRTGYSLQLGKLDRMLPYSTFNSFIENDFQIIADELKFIGSNKVTTIENIPVTKSTVLAELIAGGEVSFESGLADGREVYVVAKNIEADPIELTFTNANVQSVSIAPTNRVEFSVISIAGEYFVRVGVDSQLEEFTANEVAGLLE